MNKAFKKTKRGNYFGYYKGHYVFTYKRPHGSWCCAIGRKGEWVYAEGYFSTSLRTLSKVKEYIKQKLK